MKYYMPGPDGDPVEIDRESWICWLSTREHDEPIGRTTVGETLVSTIFLPCDHGFDGEPLLFETMVFPAAYVVGRWATLAEAKAAHAATIEAVAAGRLPPKE